VYSLDFFGAYVDEVLAKGLENIRKEEIGVKGQLLLTLVFSIL